MDEIILTETSVDNFEYLIGYIDHFNYLSDEVKGVFDPHPIKGRVYQVLKTKDNAYVLHIGGKTNMSLRGIFLGPFLDAVIENKWDYKISLIDKTNILDFEIESEDLKKISEWLDSDHAELKKEMEVRTKPKTIEELLPDDFRQALIAQEKAMNSNQQMSSNLNTLSHKDPSLFSAVRDTVAHAVSDDLLLAIRGLIFQSDCQNTYAGAVGLLLEEYTRTGAAPLILKIIELSLYEHSRNNDQEA